MSAAGKMLSSRWVAALAVAVAALAWALVAQRDPALYPGDAESVVWALWLAVGNLERNRGELGASTRALYAQGLPLRGKRALVTGATRGLGEGIASHLFALGADVVMPCRSCPADARAVLLSNAAELRRELGGAALSADSFGEVITVKMDMNDLDSVDAAVAELARRRVKVDWLVNNAGLNMPFVELSKQGFEVTMAVNHFATARFTLEALGKGLLETGRAGAKPRVVVVSSEEHRNAVRLWATGKPFGAPWGHGISDALERYGYSKLAVTTWTLELARRRKDLVVLDICPGPVASDIAQGLGVITDVVTKLMAWTFPTRFNAALPIVRMLVDEKYAALSGKHFHMAEQRDARSDAADPLLGARVWEETEKLLASRRAPTA